jgi:hypothetical protein
MPPVQVGSWQTLPSEGGDTVVLDGARMAVSGQARLCIWRGENRLATVDAPTPSPGKPRFAGDRVYWGPGFLDLNSGLYTQLPGAQAAMRPGFGERALVYAWSRRCDLLLGSFGTGNSLRPTRVTLFDGRSGTAVAALWEGSGLPPQAAWFGERALVVGFGDPRVFDHSGQHVVDIILGGATIVSIEPAFRERRLMVIDLNRSVVWIDTETWSVLDRWLGPWMQGAISENGRFVAMLEPWGKLHFACIEDDRIRPVGRVDVDPRAVALVLAQDRVITVGGGTVGWADLTVNCPAVSFTD